MGKLTDSRGFTLVEVSILLTVVVILSAMIAPVMSGMVATARHNAALADMSAIATALHRLLDDIGCVFVPQNSDVSGSPLAIDTGQRGPGRVRGGLDGGSTVVIAPTTVPPITPPGGEGADRARAFSAALASSSCSASSVCDGDAVELMVTAGDLPALGPEGDEDWLLEPDGEWVDFLEFYLISNTPGNDAGRAFPTLADCGDFVDDLFNQVRAWQGAYTHVGHGDPWGNRYAVNTFLLTQTAGEDVVILSVGPDEEIDSQFYMDGFVAGDDDLVLVLSSGPTEVPGR